MYEGGRSNKENKKARLFSSHHGKNNQAEILKNTYEGEVMAILRV
jgi:hypothetical protein